MDNKDLLQQIIANEKKSKFRMVIAIFISLILGILTFYYATLLNKSRAQAVAAEKKAEQLKEDFSESRNNLIASTDSLTLLLEKCTKENGMYTSEIEKQVIKSTRTGYLIYIQDRTVKGREKSSRIRKVLIDKGYKVPGIEKMGFDFENSIKYFHMEDKKAALEIQDIIYSNTSNRIGVVRLPKDKIPIKYVRMDAPQRQIEIWLNY